ncbi:hypothetical protein K435DRAFT_812328 [Dendrothele bispora CBS 962.96]|uniref:Uncharacterized protein n=1 Tax=Dendrothele bispora (strain CBS 962.96) TaxID=1314807 RepID=A0A4V4HB10_DENBC|nr:hypothetical protein K435DRAFT_812328 [Dendrothele bispora CBS 962.96]
MLPVRPLASRMLMLLKLLLLGLGLGQGASEAREWLWPQKPIRKWMRSKEGEDPKVKRRSVWTDVGVVAEGGARTTSGRSIRSNAGRRYKKGGRMLNLGKNEDREKVWKRTVCAHIADVWVVNGLLLLSQKTLNGREKIM